MPPKAKNHPAHIPKLNFLPKDPFYDTIVGKVMTWALKVGRYIIVFTEIIVIMSFASRFKLDRDLTDLNTSIVQKTAVVNSYADTEDRVRSIQNRSAQVAKLLAQNASVSQLQLLISVIPFDVKLTRLGYQSGQIQVAGIAKSSVGLTQFINTLQQQSAFKALTLDSVTSGSDKDPGFVFAMHIDLSTPAPAARAAAGAGTTTGAAAGGEATQ